MSAQPIYPAGSTTIYQVVFTNYTQHTLNVVIDDGEYFRIKPQQAINKTMSLTSSIIVGRWFRDGVIIRIGTFYVDPDVPYRIALMDEYLFGVDDDLRVDIRRKVGYIGPNGTPTLVMHNISLMTFPLHQIGMSILILLVIIVISIIVSIITCFAYDKIKHKKM